MAKSAQRKVITSIYPGSPADLACLKIGDEINGELKNHTMDSIKNEIIVYRNNQEFSVELPQVNKSYYNKYAVSFVDNPVKKQIRLFEAWRN